MRKGTETRKHTVSLLQGSLDDFRLHEALTKLLDVWAPADPQAVVGGVGGGSTLVAHNADIVPKVPGFVTSPHS
eukprot:1351316-Pyramimonas_sp.AAC.1